MSYKYEYTGDAEVNFPTLGISAKKGDIITSDTPIHSQNVKEITKKEKQGSE